MGIFEMEDKKKVDENTEKEESEDTNSPISDPEVEDPDCQIVVREPKIIPVIEITDSEKTLGEGDPVSDNRQEQNAVFSEQVVKQEKISKSESELEREIEEEINSYLAEENIKTEEVENKFNINSYQNKGNQDENEVELDGTCSPNKQCEEIEGNILSIASELQVGEGKSKNGGGQDETEFKGIQRMSVIMYHGDHTVKTDHKRLICLDCNTRICPVCLCNLVTHLKHHICYEDAGSHPCSSCGCIFRTPCALKAHENLHNEIFPLVCPDCGVLYQQTKYFINHSLEHCFHLFQQVRYPCDFCDDVLSSVLELKQHTKKHVTTKYMCRLCRKSFGTARKEAVVHLRKEHAVRLTSKTLTFGLDVSTYCQICFRCVPHNHVETHLTTTPMTVLVCPCEQEFTSTNVFRIHRNSCESIKCLPEDWKSNLPYFKHKNSDNSRSRKCTECGKSTSSSTNVCDQCQGNKCRQCNKVLKCGNNTDICTSCSFLPLSSICAICASDFKPKENEVICNPCLEQRSIESDWLGGEQVINDEITSFDTCELKYHGYPLDHQYCLRQDFVTKVVADKFKGPNQKESEKEEVVNKMSGMIEPCYTRKLPTSSKKPPSIKCHLCKVEFLQPGNLLYKLLLHVKKYHFNAILPTVIPENFAHVERDELDLISRLKLEKEQEKTPCSQNKEKRIDEIADSPRKRMRLYDPKQHEKKNKILQESKEIAEKENTSNLGNRSVNNETQSSPPKKDHEFWDEVYEALSVVDNRGAPKDQKERVVETFSGYSSKRQVKKPVRLVEQEVVKQQTLSRKIKADNNSEVTQPENTKVKDSIKMSSTITTPVTEKKKKTVSDEIDLELVKVKNKLRKDNELGFLAKTFQDDNKQEPNKRKRKLASKLVFNHVIDVLSEDLDPIEVKAEQNGGSKANHVCSVCGDELFSRAEFTQHLLTHRVTENSLQCMECGEGFIALPTLLKHLRAIHEISDAENYVAENNKCHETKEDASKADESVENGENKCKVCFKAFPTSLELNKHFRIHGMAFLRETQKDNKLA